MDRLASPVIVAFVCQCCSGGVCSSNTSELTVGVPVLGGANVGNADDTGESGSSGSSSGAVDEGDVPSTSIARSNGGGLNGRWNLRAERIGLTGSRPGDFGKENVIDGDGVGIARPNGSVGRRKRRGNGLKLSAVASFSRVSPFRARSRC